MPPLSLLRIDSRRQDASAALVALSQRLSPQGDIVSPAARERTIAVFGEPLSPQAVVERICRDVRRDGLAAVLDYTARLDGAQLSADMLRVPAADLARAHAAADPALLACVRRIRDRILSFQQAILHRDARVELAHGDYLAQRYVPLRRVGICVPGGAAAYPSTVLMTAVPAQAAGVSELAIVAPPTRFGSYNDDLLATCHELGIGEVYRMGGAQAVAALAYGVDGVPRVDKIVGPGNLFVALAKKFVFGDVAIDSIAGPSEVVIIADDSAPARFVAADLIAQAEHAPGASVLLTWSERLLDETTAELAVQLDVLQRGDLARQSLEEYGALVLVRDEDEAVALVERFAPEHLQIAVGDPAQLGERIRNAGAMFLGPYSPVAAGDYAAGPSHVLPTGGTARFASGLSANDFLRSHSVIHLSEPGLAALADDVRRLARTEGLTAHSASIDARFEPPEQKAPV